MKDQLKWIGQSESVEAGEGMKMKVEIVREISKQPSKKGSKVK